MITRLLLFFTLLTVVNEAAGQQVVLSTEPIDNDGFSEAKIIGQDDEGFYVLQSNLPLDLQKNRVGFKTRKLRIAYFDGNLKPRWNLPVLPSVESGAVDQVVLAQNRLLIISSAEMKSEPKMEIWIREINNRGTGSMPGNRVAALSFERSSDLDKIRFLSSADQRYSMLLLKENANSGKQLFHTMLLDSLFKPLKERNLELPYSSKELNMEDFKLSNDGDLVMLGYLNRKEKVKEGDKIKVSEYRLFSIPADEEKFSDHAVRTADKILSQAGLVIDNLNHHAVVMGFYYDKSSLTGTGVFYGTLSFIKNASFEVKTHAVDGTQHQKIIGERNSNNSGGISTYPVQKIILRNDGGAVIIAEAAFTSEYSYYDYFTQSLIRHIDYIFDNVIVVSVNRDCSLDWSAIVRKHQESTDDDGMFSSFCSLINSEELILIYNKDSERASSVAAAVITNRGDQREADVSKSGEHLSMLPTWGKQISENEMVIPVYQKKKLYLSKVTF
jgi:hypothetical protein